MHLQWLLLLVSGVFELSFVVLLIACGTSNIIYFTFVFVLHNSTLILPFPHRIPFGPDSITKAAPRASYTGSVLSTSTLDSASGLNAQSPLHIRISSRGESLATAEEKDAEDEDMEGEMEEGHVIVDDGMFFAFCCVLFLAFLSFRRCAVGQADS